MAVAVKIVDEVQIADSVRVDIAAFPCPKVTDAGLETSWQWSDIITLAITAWSTAETYKAARDEYKIGLRYFNLAKEQWDFFYNTYRPLEDQELDEIHAELEYEPDYNTAVSGHTNLIDNVFDKADSHRQALVSKYCVCQDVGQFRLTELMKQTVSGDSDNFSRRYAEQLAQERNDIRWARRVATASRGRGLLAASTAFASKAAGFYGDYAQAMTGVAENAARFTGYIQNRRNATYNAPTRRLDGRADVPNTYRGFDANAYWDSATISTDIPSNGLQWNLSNGKSPFVHAGFDPAGYADIQQLR